MLRPPTCSGCPLDSIGDSFMTAEGSGVSGVLAVAEALGEQEALDGLPLRPHAPAGAIFDRTVKRAGMDRQQLAITNICKCRPPRNLLENQPYELDAVGHCKQYMDREMERFQPKVILAMGNLPLKYLAGWTGKKRTVTNVRGFYLDGVRYPGIPVISTYHPSYIGRDKPNLLGVYRLDLLRARELASAGGRFSRPGKDYLVFPPRERVERWIEECRLNPELPISYDIETTESLTGVDESEIKGLIDGSVQITRIREEYQDIPEHLLVEKVEEVEQAEQETQIVRNTRITQIQFSCRPGEAIVLPWSGVFIELALEILALPNVKFGFNVWAFDDPILRANGAKIGGKIVDLMWGWHHYQPDLPRGLQYVTSFYIPEAMPWKHTAQADPGEYGGDDVNYPRIWGPKLLDDLQSRGLLHGYEEHVIGLNPILVGASHRGLPIDDRKRMELGGRIDEARAVVDAELQGAFPDELKPVEPKNGYVNPGIAEKKKRELGDGNGRWIQRQFQCTPRHSKVPKQVRSIGDQLTDQGTGQVGQAGGIETRWCRLQKFLPNSPKQLLAYIKWKREKEVQAKIAGYRALTRYAGMDEAGLRRMAEKNAIWQVPKELRTDRETTSKKELERLVKKTGDGFFLKVIEHREYGKARSTYVDGFKPMADGAVHTQFTFAPATGQLSCVAPWTLITVRGWGKIPIEYVQVGHEVWTHHNRWRRVTAVWYKGVQKMYEVKFSNGQVLTCTGAHRLLVCNHEYLKGVGEGPTKYTEDSGLVPRSGLSNGTRDCYAAWSVDTHGGLGIKGPHPSSGVRREEESTLLPVKAGEQEPHEGKVWKITSPLGGRVCRWVRVSDLLERWPTPVCSSNRNGECAGNSPTSRGDGCASYRWESVEQSTGQSSSSNTCGPWPYTLPSSEGLGICTVEAINPVGSYPVLDISVDEDESYEACGVFSHNSRGPNVQNMSKPPGTVIKPDWTNKQRLAWYIREMVQPKPGHVLIEGDMTAFHVLTTGFNARDANYMRLARLDMHSYVGANFLNFHHKEMLKGYPPKPERWIEMEDGELRQVLKKFKLEFSEVRNKKAKPAILGIGFGLGDKKLYDMNQESFASPKEAKQVKEIIKGLFGKVFRWQDEVRGQAHRQSYLLSPHSFIRWFFDVYHNEKDKYNGGWRMSPGKDSEAAIAFLPANNAFGVMREIMRRLDEKGLNERWGFTNNIHDSLMFHCREELAEECIVGLKEEMERPSPFLVDREVAPGGLWCGAEIAMGRSWAEMEMVR